MNASAAYPSLFRESTEQAERPSTQFPVFCPKCQHQYGPRQPSRKHKFDPVCLNCGHELKLQCEYCHDDYTPPKWVWGKQEGRWLNRFCKPSHRARWHNVNGDDNWKKERPCACGCGRIITPKKRRHIFYSDKCRRRQHRKLHAKELDAAATVYYQDHKPEIAARVRIHRQKPEVRERIHAQQRAWRAANPDKVRERNAAQRAKLAEAKVAAHAAAQAKVDRLATRLAEATADLEAMKREQQNQDAKIANEVDGAIPRFKDLFSLPEIKGNPRLLLDNWTHPDFGWDELRAAREAVTSRRPAREWPTIAARWLVALTNHYSITTVKRYHNRATSQ